MLSSITLGSRLTDYLILRSKPLDPQVKVTHLSYSSTGGAGNIASSLASAQRDLGQDSRLVTVSNRSISSEPLRDPIQSLAATLDQFVLAKKSSELFSLVRSKISRLAIEIRDEGQILHLHWLPGAISTTVIRELSKQSLRTVWTLHDYRPFTGACHYPQDCEGFASGCTSCPQARVLTRPLVSSSLRKSVLDLDSCKVDFVAPSSGLFEAVAKSQLGSAHRVHMIPYPVSLKSQSESNSIAKQPGIGKYIFVAANVDEPRKGLKQTLEWWAGIRKGGEQLILVGRGSKKYTNHQAGIRGMGELSALDLEAYYSTCSALIFSSSEDNAPGVLSEAACFGLPVICLNPNMAEWLRRDGFPFSSLDNIRAGLADKPASVFSDYYRFLSDRRPEVIAQKYLELYSGL